MKCPNCGYIHPPKKKVGKPRLFTTDQEKQIVEDKKKMTLKEVANKWECSIGTIQNIVKNT
jgi:transposase